MCAGPALQTLYRPEAEQILRSKRGFFYLRDRPEFTLKDEDVEGYDPFRKIYQGQRTLSRLCVEDFEEDVEVPAASAALPGETVAVGMLF